MNLLEVNMGTLDRVMRLAEGLAVIILGLSNGSWWGLLGLVPLATAATSSCPMYSLLGVRTCPVKQA